MQRLSELGFVEGRNLVIEHRASEGNAERLPGLAAELARPNCDVLLAAGTEAVLVALKQASRRPGDRVDCSHVAPLPGCRSVGFGRCGIGR